MLLALGAGALLAFQKPILSAIYARGAMLNIGRDMSAGLPDGLHAFVCGSGAPLPDARRAGPCLAVLAGDRAFVFDAGEGGANRLTRSGFPVAKIERLFLTHLHSDHFDGLGALMLQTWVGAARAAPLPVTGPIGTSQVVAGFNAAYRIDAGYRTAHHGPDIAPASGFGLTAEEFDLSDLDATNRVVFSDGDVLVTAFSVSHEPVRPAFGYRVDYKGRSVVISGDTAYSQTLVAAAKGADVLFHDALAPDMVALLAEAANANEQPRLAKIMSDIPDYHASPQDAARAAAASEVRALVLTHIVPPMPSRIFHSLFLGDAKARFRGELRIGEDGLLVSLPAKSETIAFGQRL